MSRPFRLTPRAEFSLVGIARWTEETFGPRQADLYAEALIARCDAIARGDLPGRSCAVFVAGAAELQYARAGEHFVVYLDRPDAVIVIDFLHSRSDLPRRVAALTRLIGESG